MELAGITECHVEAWLRRKCHLRQGATDLTHDVVKKPVAGNPSEAAALVLPELNEEAFISKLHKWIGARTRMNAGKRHNTGYLRKAGVDDHL
ncbi:MAG: hypothetical protein AB1700_05350 [Bacillota bacterium]